MEKLHILRERFIKRINDVSLRRKLRYFYYFCILVPIIFTDAIIMRSLIKAEQVDQRHEMEEIASSVRYQLSTFVENSSVVARSIYMDDAIQEFLGRQYDTPSDYVSAYNAVLRDSLIEGIKGIDNTVITVYADNDTIINGGGFIRLSDVERAEWYRQYKASSKDSMLLFYYDENDGRKALYLRSLNRPLRDKAERFVKIEMDYGALARNIKNTKYNYPVYICTGDKVVISNEETNNLGQDFSAFAFGEREIGCESEYEVYGAQLHIYVLRKTNGVLSAFSKNMPLVVALLLLNIFVPLLLMNQIEYSITRRIFKLGQVFEQVDSDELPTISGEMGKDEIGNLMENYNRMAKRMNELIQMVYRDQLKKQEMYIARQKAELLALYSQINSHFLFNVLESIRMHSILKGENETAEMVQKLAVMERQNVDWSTDVNTVKKEMESVEAYLALQKYRFGERLSYEIDMEERCETLLIPKITITTFVENACIHGFESKTAPGWIFVRVYIEEEWLCIEVEDTGGGMDDDMVKDISEKMRNANIDMLKGKGRVGIVNACLRIRMMTGDMAQFSIESETGIGTVVIIRIPLEKLEREERDAESSVSRR